MKKTPLIIAGIILAAILLFVGIFMSTNNRVVSMEEQIKSSKSAIDIQYKRRAYLIPNLVDAAVAYGKYESETMQKVIQARADASSGKVDNAAVAIKAVAEAYPELKADKHYAQVMTELAITENKIAGYREDYNSRVQNYTRYIKSQPAKLILGMMGYQPINNTYLEYNASDTAPKNLFGK
jgi:LemA protein